MTGVPFAAEVADYLDDCTVYRAALDPRFHPTETGALKMIPHRRHADQDAEDQIRAAYQAALTRNGRAEPARARRPEEPAMPDAREILESSALAAAARGWRVFPITPGAKKPPAFPAHTAERCDGTDPRCRDGHQGWEQRATADPGRIERAWARAPYNVGIAAGPSGLVVVDLDVPKPGEVPPPRWDAPGICDGADVLAVLADEHGEAFPWETFTVRTRRGGWHLYFTAPDGARLGNTAGSNPNGLGWLIDTRAHGGYVVAAGSIVTAPEGTGRYEVANDREPAALPGWLAGLLTADRSASSPLPECRSNPVEEIRDVDRYLTSALREEEERVASAVEGGRNAALNKAAYNLAKFIVAGTLDDTTVERELYRAASVHFGVGTPPFTPGYALSVIRSAITARKNKAGQLDTREEVTA